MLVGVLTNFVLCDRREVMAGPFGSNCTANSKLRDNQPVHSSSPHTVCSSSTKDYATLQAASAVQIRTFLPWDVTQHRLVISYRRFGTTYRSHIQTTSNPGITCYRRFGTTYRSHIQIKSNPGITCYRRFGTTYLSHLQVPNSTRKNTIPTFRDILSVPSSSVKQSKEIENRTNRFSRNTGNQLPVYAA
jgi:hypothetical protein